MTQRVTIACPVGLMAEASHVQVLLGKTSRLDTYQNAQYEAADGAQYAVSSGLWTPAQIAGLDNPAVLDMPSLQPLYTVNGGPVDRALCEAAQAAFRWWSPGDPFPSAHIVGILGIEGRACLDLLGLRAVYSLGAVE